MGNNVPPVSQGDWQTGGSTHRGGVGASEKALPLSEAAATAARRGPCGGPGSDFSGEPPLPAKLQAPAGIQLWGVRKKPPLSTLL